MVKRSKKIGVFLLFAALVVSIFVAPIQYSNDASAAVKTKTVSGYDNYYSWAGLKIFTVGVKGFYDSNGRKVTSFGKVSPEHNTNWAWSIASETAYWTSEKNTSQAQAYAKGKFVLGVSTSLVTIGVQTVTKSITVTGKP